MNRFTRTIPMLLLAGALAVAHADDTKAAHDGHQAAAGETRMRDNMPAMRDLMRQIRATDDPVKRHELLEKHRELMREQMRDMKGRKHMDGCDGMMDQMLDQMMEHEQADNRTGHEPAK